MYYSQNGQDQQLNERIFQNARNGTFVEFGALDGISGSNSLFFERELGWTGLLIEADPVSFSRLRRNRPNITCLNTAIYAHDGAISFERYDGGAAGWGGVAETFEAETRKLIEEYRLKTKKPLERFREFINIPCITLDRALSQNSISHIDYLSIDVEGAEYTILSVFPFSKYSISVIGVENNNNKPQIDALMISNDFQKVARIGSDDIYLHQRWFSK